LNLSDPSSLLPRLPQGAQILIVRLRSLGDVVLTTPALAALHSWRPDILVSVLVEKEWAGVLEGNPCVSEILIAGWPFATGLAMRRRKFSIVFNQHGGPSSALITALTGAPARVCWTGRQFSFAYNVLAPPAVEFFGARPVHTAEHRATQFYWTGLPRGPVPPAAVFPQPDAAVTVQKTLENRGIGKGTAYAVFQPGARYFTKRWALEKFAAVAGWLKERHSIRAIVIAGPGESQIAADLRAHFGAATVLDTLGLRELIALIAGARLYVGNDGGPMHLAAALQVPAAAIFGSSSSVYWRPWGSPHRVVQNDFPCNPCRGDRCYAFDEPKCILSIDVEQVERACEELLREEKSEAEALSTQRAPGAGTGA
jgi:heptosyltransferase III